MSETQFDPDYDDLFRRAREAARPPADAKARVLTAVMSQAAAVPSPSPAPSSVGSTKVAAWIVAGSMVAAAIGYLAWPSTHDRTTSAVPSSPSSSAIAANSTSASATATPSISDAVSAEAPAPSMAPAPRPTVKPSSTKSSAAPDTLDQEIALLAEARSALSAGDAQTALALLDSHAARFPKSVLSQERTVIRIEALCAAGRTEEARTLLIAMRASAPSSPHYAAIRRACPTLVEELP